MGRPVLGRVDVASSPTGLATPPAARARELPDVGAHPLLPASGAGERAPSRWGVPPGYARRR